MDQCPTCHAAVRHGSRFCTSCGGRLPDPAWFAPSVPTGDASTEPAAAFVPAATGWPAPSPWHAPAASHDPVAPDPSAATFHETARDDSVIAPPVWRDDPDPIASDAIVAWSTVDAGAAESDERPEIADPPGVAGIDAAEAADATDATRAADDDASEPMHEGEQAAGDVSAPGVLDARPDETGAIVEPRAQAERLLDALRELLPILATAGPSVDLNDLADSLTVAATEPTERWEVLRSALEQARDHPRDVETVLALARRADDAIALLEAHDALVVAARRAAAALRASAPGADPA